MKVEYSSSNSGGNWWLTDENWLALEEAGWKVDWFRDQEEKSFTAGNEGRWLGALANRASKEGATSLEEAAKEWEKITGACATDAGCPCCATPHTFTLYNDEGKCVNSGPNSSYECHW